MPGQAQALGHFGNPVERPLPDETHFVVQLQKTIVGTYSTDLAKTAPEKHGCVYRSNLSLVEVVSLEGILC